MLELNSLILPLGLDIELRRRSEPFFKTIRSHPLLERGL